MKIVRRFLDPSEGGAMTAPLTRSRNAVYRSPVGAESVPIWLREGLTETTAPKPRRASASSAVFLWLGAWITLQGVAGYPWCRFFAKFARPATRASAKCPDGLCHDRSRSSRNACSLRLASGAPAERHAL